MLRNIGTIVRGTVIAQALGLAALPLLTRLFDPTAFGHLQLYLSIVTLLIVLPSLRYDIGILRASNRELPSLLRLCLGANVAVAVALTMVAYGGAAIFSDSWLARTPFPLWLPIAAMLVSGLAQVLLYIAIRDERFGVNANSKMAQGASYATFAVALGWARAGMNGLIFADFFGRLVNLAWLGHWFRKRGLSPVDTRITVSRIARRYREYPLFALPGGIINSAGGVLTPIMVYATFSAPVAGQFGLVDRALTLPIGLLVVAVSQVFMGQLAAALRAGDGGARAHFFRLLRWIALLGAVPAVLVMFLAEPVFVLLFGDEWLLAGTLARIMAPAYFTMLLAGCVNMTLSVIGRQKTQMAWEIGRLAAMAMLWGAVFAWRLPVTTAIMLHSAVLVATNAVFLLLCGRALRNRGQATPHAAPIEAEPT